ncbi:cache domain-containing protein [Undibacterium sp. TJN19]|uniref:cache domain-containing protein n=1 Tax=Undibacterium sp. TJN19 TaxID=3413055 RepID=UPI003BF23065
MTSTGVRFNRLFSTELFCSFGYFSKITSTQGGTMKQTYLTLVFGILVIAQQSIAVAAEKSTEAEAIALIQKAQEYIKKNGVEKSIVEFNKLDSPFNTTSDINKKGDLYLFTVDQKGYQAVHGKNPKIVGKVMVDMRDQDGVYLIKEMAEKCFATGKGLVAYRWPNPVTKDLEKKKGYVERVPGQDFCIGTGYYY